MSKRFTENQKWEDVWFRRLPPVSKLFWLFVVDKCDIAGFWEIDWDLASFYIGAPVDDSILADFEGRLERVNNNGKLWIVKFIEFQYGTLNPAVNPHKPVIKLLEKKGLLDRVKGLIINSEGLKKGSGRVTEGLRKGYATLKDKDKDKDKDKAFKEGDCKGEEKALFEELWLKYPNKDGKKDAAKHFMASVKSEEDCTNIQQAMKNYLASKNVKEGFVKKGATWFNNWRDWVDFAGVGIKPAAVLPKYDEDREFICGRCRLVKGKDVLVYTESGDRICQGCLDAEEKQKGREFRQKWAEMSVAERGKHLQRLKEYNLPILPWMKEENVKDV